MATEEQLKIIEQTRWYHTFEILPGTWTKGERGYKVNPKARLDNARVPPDLSGKTVLDIGTFDGMYAFELERRGAEVWAVDIQDPDSTAFNTAKSLLSSNVRYLRTTVYEIVNHGLPKFDLVLFFGVFYHLKHPVLGFRRIRNVLKDNGTVHFDGVVLDSLWQRYEFFESYKDQISAVRHLPISYYTDPKKVSWNWTFPTCECVRSWLITTGFRDPVIKFYEEQSSVVGMAVADEGIVPEEHVLSNANSPSEAIASLKEDIY